MSVSLALACVWVVLASAVAMGPRRFHWPAALMLAASGIPLLGWVTWENGAYWGLGCLIGGASILRWPLIHVARRIAGRATP
ncbi:DUF2484 family protein [Gemmobacter sp. LW-1]|jgi:hypothetical protein|uniref:DUF2484 family protein n=1 Tax=Gemmobacter sp. LW-1 TaxID=1529005 RepID=UPI0006C76335|nr:DUF2484 family protein [Gemmobacter sp. LW-1]